MKNLQQFGKVFLVGTAIVLIAAGCNSATKSEQANNAPATTQDQAQTKSEAISYKGVEGKTALELLKAQYQVETQNYEGVGEFVKSINGVTPSTDQFWGFYVNGKSSNVGAGDYQSKADDQIEWKLDTVGEYTE